MLTALLGYSLGFRGDGGTGWFEGLALRLGGPAIGTVASARYTVAGIFNAVLPGGSSLDLDAESRRLRAEPRRAQRLAAGEAVAWMAERFRGAPAPAGRAGRRCAAPRPAA